MRKWGSIVWMLALLIACSSEEPRTQITLMIDAEPRVKSEIDNVRVTFSSGPRGSDREDFVARPAQDFSTPFTWPLVVVLVPAGDDANRAFQITVSGRDGTDAIVEASAQSHFLKGKHLALRLRLIDMCRNAVFAGCDDGETCLVDTGGAHCANDAIDPAALPAFDGVDSTSDAGFDAQVSAPREIVGRVFSTDGLLPLSGANVSLASGAAVTTNSDGEFTLTGSDIDRVITIEHPSHALAIKPLPSAASVYLEVFVKEVDVRQTLSATTGGTVQSTNGAAAVFPPSAFKRPNGNPETGMAEVTLASPDTKDGAQAQAFPGDFKAVASGGKEGAFAAVAALDVTATAAGGKLNLNDGAEVEISLPVKTPSTAQTLDLWSFDPAQRTWGKEGMATLTQDATGKPIYRAKISHLSWWAVGTLVEDTACMHLCATHASTPAAFARATVTGIDAPLQGSFFADDTGCVAFDVPPSTQVSVVVQSIDGVSAPSVVVTPSTLGSSDDLSTCENLGAVVLMDRNQSTSACPGGLAICDGACVNLSSDPIHCGSCSGNGSVCALGQRCVSGACGCANSETACDGYCVDTANDRAHCGGCGNACASNQRCTLGQCVSLTCAPPTTNCDGICVDLARDGTSGLCPNTTLPDCAVPTHCPVGAMCADNGLCVPIATCAVDEDCPSAYRCNDMTFVCEVPNCGMAGYSYCRDGVGCVDLAINAASCGACGRACSAGATCSAGQCIPPCVPVANCQQVGADCGMVADGCGGLLDCGTCMGAETCGGGGVPNVCGSVALCGDAIVAGNETCDDGNQQSNDGCSVTCQVENGWTCPIGGGLCVMLSDPCNGLDDDSDTLVDEGFVPNNCGVNGGECVSGVTACVAGSPQCVGAIGPVAELCDGLDNDCDGAIDNGFSLNNDVNNCGSCGFVCGSQNAASSICMAGSCNVACQSGWASCDGNPNNGCETSLNTLSNCGSCGGACGTSCVGGVCLP